MNSLLSANISKNSEPVPSPTFGPPSRPCISSRGPSPAKMMLLGEAPGQKEEELGIPFVGSSGRELENLLLEAGINPGSVFMTNVLKTRPPDNKLQNLFIPNDEWKAYQKTLKAGPSTSGLSSSTNTNTSIPPIKLEGGKLYHLPPMLHAEIATLHEEIEKCQPNVIVCLGNTALWSMTGRQNISSLRGTVLQSSTLSVSRKLLPTYHPAAVLRQWDLRTIVLADLMKAKVQAEFPEIRRPRREILVNPTLLDLAQFVQSLDNAKLLSCDVETRNGQITEIGFATSPTFALVVPFIKGYKENYWPSAASEATALRAVRAILQHPIPKLFQNGLYDIQYIIRTWGCAPRNCLHDTMLLHHAIYPELQKGLGFLGSIYTEEPAWKIMRNRRDKEKADDE